MFETGQFAALWQELAGRLGLDVVMVEGDWRHGVSADEVESRLGGDKDHQIKAVCVVHNETSTGVVSNIQAVRKAMDAANHPTLLFVDTISSLASIDYRHDEWGVDVTVGCSQKGLMLPPGLGFNAVSEKALAAAETAGLPRSYWDWQAMISNNANGFFPYTPSTNLLYGLDVALDMLLEEGLDNVFQRHNRLAEATRRAVRAWGLEILCLNPEEYSPVLTAVLMPDGHDADALRSVIFERFDMSLGTGLGKVKGQGLPNRPPWRFQRTYAGGDAGRGGNGPGHCRRSPRKSRNPGGPGLSFRPRRRRRRSPGQGVRLTIRP